MNVLKQLVNIVTMIESKNDFYEYVLADMKANKVADNFMKYFNVIYKYLYCLRKVAYFYNTHKNRQIGRAHV